MQLLPELNSGGVERGTLEIARALVAQGHQSLVVSNGGRLVSQLEAEDSIQIVLFQLSGIMDLLYFKRRSKLKIRRTLLRMLD